VQHLSTKFAPIVRTFPIPVPVRSVPVVLALTAFVLFTGCRTYGNEQYDNAPKMYSAMQEAVQQFDDALNRANVDLRKLEEAAERTDTLSALADRFRGVVAKHDSMLARQRAQVDKLSGDSNYRALHRVYGAIVTDQRLITLRYRRTIQQVRAAVQPSASDQSESLAEAGRSYSIRPVGSPSDREEDPLTMDEALRAAPPTPGLQGDG
jgi:hypothetical protein